MNITIEDIDTALRAIRPNQFELTQALAFRTTMSTVKMGQVLAEARRRGLVATHKSANAGHYEHVIQNKGRDFLEWIAAGRLAGHL